MSESINLMKNVSNLEISDEVTGYSGVRIYAGQDDEGNEIVYEAGNDTGKVLEMKNEFGSQEMANNVLARVRGFQYQPYEANGAILDPSAELGDGVTINGIYSGIYIKATNFSKMMASNISAPTDEEIEHEFTQESATDRQYTRFTQQTRAMLKVTNQAISAEVTARTEADNSLSSQLAITASQISAKVSKTGGDSSSFGWNLTDSDWTVYSGGNAVLKVTSGGAEVNGKITATSGFIGSSSNGFTISSGAIYKNISQYGGTQTTGVYIGTNGIQLGQRFKVDSSGNLQASNIHASSGTFEGNVYAKNISYGGSYGTFSGEGLTGSSVGTGKVTRGINISLGYANFSNDVFNDHASCEYMRVNKTLAASKFSYKGYEVKWNYFSPVTGVSASVEKKGIYVTGVTVSATKGAYIYYLGR